MAAAKRFKQAHCSGQQIGSMPSFRAKRELGQTSKEQGIRVAEVAGYLLRRFQAQQFGIEEMEKVGRANADDWQHASPDAVQTVLAQMKNKAARDLFRTAYRSVNTNRFGVLSLRSRIVTQELIERRFIWSR